MLKEAVRSITRIAPNLPSGSAIAPAGCAGAIFALGHVAEPRKTSGAPEVCAPGFLHSTRP